MAGDPDTNLHPSHISEGIWIVSLLHLRFQVCFFNYNFFDVRILLKKKKIFCLQRHAAVSWRHLV